MWDKDSRTDRVFGSTGQTILHPFSGINQQGKDLILAGKQTLILPLVLVFCFPDRLLRNIMLE